MAIAGLPNLAAAGFLQVQKDRHNTQVERRQSEIRQASDHPRAGPDAAAAAFVQ